MAPLQARVAAGPGHECRGGLDGARWLVEFSGGGRYKVAQSFSPDTGPIHDLGIAMLGLTGWTFTNVY
ncbi:MAG: hypothetical protein EON96_13200 [Caulobacteraceae bacterium]|nr:MAG: hypothetical protein EON96_13200 [Caulobacteraceae bacterium]